MLHTIEISTGIDAVIEKVKASLYAKLEEKFPSADIDGFGRVHRNRKEGGLVPEFRVGNEYTDVFLDDRKDVVFSFVTSEDSSTEDEFVFVNEVKLSFFLNLEKLYGQYLDAKAHEDLVSIVRSIARERYTITGIEVGVENVFEGFDVEQVKFGGIAPWHCFGINLDLYYNLKAC